MAVLTCCPVYHGHDGHRQVDPVEVGDEEPEVGHQHVGVSGPPDAFGPLGIIQRELLLLQ